MRTKQIVSGLMLILLTGLLCGLPGHLPGATRSSEGTTVVSQLAESAQREQWIYQATHVLKLNPKPGEEGRVRKYLDELAERSKESLTRSGKKPQLGDRFADVWGTSTDGRGVDTTAIATPFVFVLIDQNSLTSKRSLWKPLRARLEQVSSAHAGAIQVVILAFDSSQGLPLILSHLDWMTPHQNYSWQVEPPTSPTAGSLPVLTKYAGDFQAIPPQPVQMIVVQQDHHIRYIEDGWDAIMHSPFWDEIEPPLVIG